MASLSFIEQPRSLNLNGSDIEFLESLGGPSWFQVPGRDPGRARAVVTLLHGNEPSGVRAIQAWLRAGNAPATDALFYIVSVQTALTQPRGTLRLLADGRDMNRCFAPPFSGPEGALAKELLEQLRSANPEALIDLHNNTGNSPAYAVGSGVDDPRLQLTALFADRYMNSDLRLSTLVEAVSPWFPSVAIECGKAGDPVADAVALAGLERYLAAEPLFTKSSVPSTIQVLDQPVRVSLLPNRKLAFGTTPLPDFDLTLKSDVDQHNFRSLPVGTTVGWLGENADWPIEARGADSRDISRELFKVVGRELRVRRSMIPVMMTTSPLIARQDCLFYAMRKR